MGWEPAIVFLCVGMGFLVLLNFPLKRLPLAGLLPLSFLAGVFSITFSLLLVALVTGHLYFSLIWLLCLPVLVGLVLRWSSIKQQIMVSFPTYSHGEMSSVLLIIPLLIFMLANALLVVHLATLYPIIGFDAIGNYAMKAKMWYHTGLLLPPQLLDSEFVMFHRDYPPAIPISEAAWSMVLGYWSAIKLKYFFLFCWLCTGCLVYAHLRRGNSSLCAWLGLSFWFLLPYHLMELHGGATDAYPEIPYIAALLLAFILVKEFARERKLALVLTMALMVASTILIKQEGLLFILLVIVYMVWVRAPLRNISLIIIASAVCYLLIVLANRNIPALSERGYFALYLTPQLLVERVRILAGFVVSEPFYKERWGNYFWYVFVLIWLYKGFVLGWHKWRKLFNLDLLFCLGLTLLYLMVLLNTRLDFSMHLDTTLHRLMLHVYPLLIIATFDNCMPSADAARP